MQSEKPGMLFQRSFVLKILRRTVAALLFLGLFYGIVAAIYATKTIFKVKENYAVVLEKFGGNRDAVTDVGWHVRLPFFTRIEQEVTLMNQTMFLGGEIEPMRIISRENVALWTSGLLTYRIRNLDQWAIENQLPMTLLQGDYDGVVKDILQAQSLKNLISEREEIKEEIFLALKSRPINEGGPSLEQKYGIEVVSFVLRDTRFGDQLIAASEEKKRRELIAEGENYAASQEADRIRKLYAAYLEGISALQEGLGGRQNATTDQALLNFLAQQKWADAYEKNQAGQNTVVIQGSGDTTPVTLPLPATDKDKDRNKDTE